MRVNLITRGEKQWDDLGVPKFGECDVEWDLRVPLNLPYNTTLYKQRKKQLIAFRILAYARCGGKYGSNKYLVQEAGCTPEWKDAYFSNLDVLFRSKEDFFDYLEGDTSKGFVVELEWIQRILPMVGMRTSWSKTWRWDDTTSRPKQRTTYIRYLTITSDGLNIVFSKGENDYWSAEECIAGRLDGMEIVEFPDDEYSVNINIEVAPNPPKIHTLKFMEE